MASAVAFFFVQRDIFCPRWLSRPMLSIHQGAHGQPMGFSVGRSYPVDGLKMKSTDSRFRVSLCYERII